MKTKLRSHFHCVYNLNDHLVLVTKYRRRYFTNDITDRLEEICKNICKLWDIELLEFGGEPDHIHLLPSMHPNMMHSRFVNNLKTVSSRLIKERIFQSLGKVFLETCFTDTGLLSHYRWRRSTRRHKKVYRTTREA
jgi:putative transposase